MLELFVISSVVFLALCCLAGIFKLLLGLVLLPLKLALMLVGGIATAAVGVPLLVAGVAIAAGVFPAVAVIFFLLIPAFIVCGLVAVLLRLIF